jgi:SAM-dependent methyltransferase
MSDEPRKRRSLTHVGGTIETEGEVAAARALAHALDVAPSTDADDDVSRAHVHGFHTYPARMHPATAARLVQAFVPPGGRVLDPFCGSGTVLVEALVLGRGPLGVDLNPLAVRLARCKTRPRTAAELDHLVAQARACAAHADERRRTKAGATRRFPAEDINLFEPHVLLELDSLRAKIAATRDDPARDLSLVLSAILVKLSRKRGDTSAHVAPRRTAPGYAAKLFVQKAEDLARRLAALGALLPSPPPRPAVVAQDDATVLRTLPPGPVDAIVTSPPYAGTYDYVAHHALRLRWLGLDATPLARGELGARSAYRRIDPRAAGETWSNELARFLHAAARVLPHGGPLVMLMADSAVGGVALRADVIVADTARACGFVPAARASQPRPHFHGPTMAAFHARPRAEHAILLRRGP